MGISVFIFSWLVDFLLLMGTVRLSSGRMRLIRFLMGPILCAAYATLALRTWFASFVTPIFACAIIIVCGLIAFGCRAGGLRSCGLFLFLHLVVAGVLQPRWLLCPWPLLLSSLLLLLCIIGFPEESGNLVPIELSYGTNHMSLTALRDTGNTLHDPVTGKPILILGADAAQYLTGLTVQQLRCPVEAMGTIPGLRLIPYRAIGGGGLLLALHLPMIRIGHRRGSGLVAFAPEILSENGKFQALTGGTI